MKKTLPLLLFVLLIAGCYRPDAERAASWTKPGATEDEIYADITSCRQQADAMIERDAAIDSDIDSSSSANTFGSTATDLEANLDAYDAGKRHRRIIAECMHGRGYALSSDS